MEPRHAPTDSDPAAGSSGPDGIDVPGGRAQGVLLTWYQANARDLPWRAPGTTPWGVLVSEVMLQQTPVARVEPVWRTWLDRWPTPADLAAARLDDMLRAWGTLGYPRRARRLSQAAAALVDRHDGQVPDDELALRTLPGVGQYTAAAVLAFAFGRRAVVLDTNIRRVLARTVDGDALPAPTHTRAETTRAEAMVPSDDRSASALAAAWMELGATVCTARAPQCDRCPVNDVCAWRASGSPPDRWAGRRRAQPWNGTDRQARGRVLAAARGQGTVLLADIVWPDREQLARCVGALVVEGLLEQPHPDEVTLPS
jgi:A/G-specific adenine glycosylase